MVIWRHTIAILMISLPHSVGLVGYSAGICEGSVGSRGAFACTCGSLGDSADDAIAHRESVQPHQRMRKIRYKIVIFRLVSKFYCETSYQISFDPLAGYGRPPTPPPSILRLSLSRPSSFSINCTTSFPHTRSFFLSAFCHSAFFHSRSFFHSSSQRSPSPPP